MFTGWMFRIKLLTWPLARFCFFLGLGGLLLLMQGCFTDVPDLKWELATQGVYAASLSQDGDALVLGSINHGGSYWQLQGKHERVYNWNLDQGRYSALRVVALSRDKRFALTADERRFVIWSTDSGKSVGFWNTPADITSAALSDGGAFALVGLDNYEALYVDVKQGGIVTKLPHSASVVSVAISQDGGLGLTGSEDGVAQVWILKKAQAIRLWHPEPSLKLVTLSGDGKTAFTASQHSGGVVWDARKENEKLLSISMRSATITAARFNSDNLLVIGTSAREVQLWNWKDAKKKKQWIASRKSLWKPESAYFLDVALSKSTNTAIAVASNGAVYGWVLPQ